MNDKSGVPNADTAAQELGHVVMTGLWYTPTGAEIDQVRTYLAEVEASIDLLPALTPEQDSLDVGYDPAWPEVSQ